MSEKKSDIGSVPFPDLVAEMIRRCGDDPDREGLVKTPERVVELLVIAGLGDVFERFNSMDEAKKMVEAMLRVIEA